MPYRSKEPDDYLLGNFSAAHPEVHALFTYYAGNIDMLLSRPGLQLCYGKPLL